MAQMEPKALLKRAERAARKRDRFASLMRDVGAYAMPERDSWSSYGEGQDRQVQVFDSTATRATSRFATRLQAALFPAQQRWARLALPPELATEEAAQELQQDLEAATNKLFAHVHASAFDMVIHEWAHDLAAGVGALLVENGRLASKRSRAPLLRFQAIPAASVAFDEGPFGAVEGVFFDQTLPARLVDRTYPDHTGLPPVVAQQAKDDPDAEVPLLQATYYDPEADRYRLEVIHKASEQRIVARQHRTMPWIITRWIKAPGETHGRGPLTQALPDIRTLNKVVELWLKTGSFAVAGVWTARDDGVLNPGTVRIVPGAVIPVASNGGPMGPSLAPLTLPGNWQVSETLQEQLRTAIRQTLFDDPLPPEVQVGLTATEVIERVRRFQADTGAFGRLQTDAVTPLVLRCVDILEEAGEFAGPRFQGLMDALMDDAIRAIPTSPLSQAQDNADVQAVMGFIGGAAQMGEPGAAMLETGVDLDLAGPFVAQRMGVPQQLIPTAERLAEKRAARAEAQQQQAVLASPAAAQVAGALANAAVNPAQPEPMA